MIENITQYLSELSSVPRNHVEAMLVVIDHEEYSICSRLELRAFAIIYDILSLTEEGSAYERGLALLTVGNSSEVQSPKLNDSAIIIRKPHFFVAGKQTAGGKERRGWRHCSSQSVWMFYNNGVISFYAKMGEVSRISSCITSDGLDGDTCLGAVERLRSK